MQGRPMEGLFDVCHIESDDFCPSATTDQNASNVWDQLVASSFDSVKETVSRFWSKSTAASTNISECTSFNLNPLTVGQVASASSAAAGGGAVQTWVQNAITLVRKTTRSVPMRCTVLPMLIENFLSPCNAEAVKEEIMTFLGCKSFSIWEKFSSSWANRNSAIIAKQWSAFLQKWQLR